MALAGCLLEHRAHRAHSTRTHVLVTSCIRMAGLDTLLGVSTRNNERACDIPVHSMMDIWATLERLNTLESVELESMGM